jgi:hypothetical protein
MSDRRVSATDERMRDLLRDVLERLYRLENGGAIAGRVSFGSEIEIGGDIGGVEITVSDIGGGGKTVTFRNMTTGSTFTINLP